MHLSPLLLFHICGGSVGLLAGTVSMAVRKGGSVHRLAGQVFVGGMLCLAASGAIIGYLRAEPSNIIGGLITMYMILTAWLTGHKDGRTGAFDIVALLFAVVLVAYSYQLGLKVFHMPHHALHGVPAAMTFFLGSVVLFAAAGDGRMLIRGGITGARRIGRHAWRMSFGLFIATGSFFLGQQQVFPAQWRGSAALMVLGLLPLALLMYWAVRVRFGIRFRDTARPRYAGAPHDLVI